MNSKTQKCDECKSLYFSESSEMISLCPECSFYLYGKKNCEHKFENGRCVNCYWNGKSSKYVNNLKSDK